jgi:hypothetical protein
MSSGSRSMGRLVDAADYLRDHAVEGMTSIECSSEPACLAIGGLTYLNRCRASSEDAQDAVDRSRGRVRPCLLPPPAQERSAGAGSGLTLVTV